LGPNLVSLVRLVDLFQSLFSAFLRLPGGACPTSAFLQLLHVDFEDAEVPGTEETTINAQLFTTLNGEFRFGFGCDGSPQLII
jgi:hypothetical protein